VCGKPHPLARVGFLHKKRRNSKIKLANFRSRPYSTAAMKNKVTNDSVILQFSDDENTIHEVGLDSILIGGFPIDPESGNEMEYIQTYILEEIKGAEVVD